MRPIDFFITQLKAQGPSRTCNETNEEEEEEEEVGTRPIQITGGKFRTQCFTSNAIRGACSTQVTSPSSSTLVRWRAVECWRVSGTHLPQIPEPTLSIFLFVAWRRLYQYQHVRHACTRGMCSGSEAGSYLRLIDVCITQL